MTVTWRLTAEDLQKAVSTYLLEKYDVSIDHGMVKFAFWNDNLKIWSNSESVKAEASGHVEEGLSMGPYR